MRYSQLPGGKFGPMRAIRDTLLQYTGPRSIDRPYTHIRVPKRPHIAHLNFPIG